MTAKDDYKRAQDYIEHKIDIGNIDFETIESISQGREEIMSHINFTAKRSAFPRESVIAGNQKMIDNERFDGIIKSRIPYFWEIENESKSRPTLEIEDKVRLEIWRDGGYRAVARRNGRIVTWLFTEGDIQ